MIERNRSASLNEGVMKQPAASISIAILRIGDGWRIISDGGAVGAFL